MGIFRIEECLGSLGEKNGAGKPLIIYVYTAGWLHAWGYARIAA